MFINKMSCFVLTAFVLAISSCTDTQSVKDISLEYPNLLNVTHTPDVEKYPKQSQGYFTDHGSWMGFSFPEIDAKINGFCGPVDLDSRRWVSQSIAEVSAVKVDGKDILAKEFVQDSVVYYPGKILLVSSTEGVQLKQEMLMVSERHALLRIATDQKVDITLSGTLSAYAKKFSSIEGASVIATLPKGEVISVTMPANVIPETDSVRYDATAEGISHIDVVISYYNSKADYNKYKEEATSIVANPEKAYQNHIERWNDYIAKNLRDDMSHKYNRIMVKTIMTMMSNWRSPKEALLHSGVVPSHAMNYFVGFWAWDSWKHAVALADIDPALAKDQIRAMFDYQSEEGMIADCIYTDITENNWRDSKPPLSGWAINKIYEATGDKEFLEEMYPKLLKYHEWWYKYRDHNQNGICEFGATDGTLEAAKWESGMDNAVRFDDACMLKNSAGAWSFDQESVELNVYLVYEYELLKKMAGILGKSFDLKDRTELVRDYFFDTKDGYFYDKNLSGEFVKVQGPEGWSPLWTGIATKDQADEAVKIMFDTTKFSTYIPFPTLAADNPKFMPRGYWRGPIWLDQVYFGISSLRKYGYVKEADNYTDQVFTRLDGLNEDGAIHENYETSTGKQLKASHFSWSSAHLFMLYKEYGKFY